MLVEHARCSGVLIVSLVLAVVVALLPGHAAASTCGREPADDEAVAALVADARAACPCDGFLGRASFRRCVRERSTAAVVAGTLPSRCRATVIRMANRSTCGDVPSAVTCCVNLSAHHEACTISRSAIACEGWRGGKGQVGSSDWCHDACPPSPTPWAATPTPTPTVTPSGPPTPLTGLGPRCVCVCGPGPSPWPLNPYGRYGCPSFHYCIVMSFVPTGNAECDALDDGSNRQCNYHADAPRPDPVHGPFLDVCDF